MKLVGDDLDPLEGEKQHDEAEETLDESGDPLDESAHTVDSSDEEIDESVAEDIVRFESSFEGINKRYRLINRVGEGESARRG